MPRQPLTAVLVALLIGCWLSAEPNGSQENKVLTGKVVAIADGDTLTVLDAENTQHKIRLEGIDAPERGQDYGDKSRQALAAAVFV